METVLPGTKHGPAYYRPSQIKRRALIRSAKQLSTRTAHVNLIVPDMPNPIQPLADEVYTGLILF